MRMFDPDAPSTQELHSRYSVDTAARADIAAMRQRVSRCFRGESDEMAAVIGPCAATADRKTMLDEAGRLAQLTAMLGLFRACMWKPRSDPNEPFWGHETVDPEVAYAMLHELACQSANIETEMGHPLHVVRYSGLIAVGRVGSRTVGNRELIEAIATHDPTLPVEIKNEITGGFDAALQQADLIKRLRGAGRAPAILIYRGGSTVDTPKKWAEMYKRAWEATDGRIGIDVAHGTSMAHDDGQKSERGQVSALDHTGELVRNGYAPRLIMAEASGIDSPTDPNADFDSVLVKVQSVGKLARQGVATR